MSNYRHSKVFNIHNIAIFSKFFISFRLIQNYLFKKNKLGEGAYYFNLSTPEIFLQFEFLQWDQFDFQDWLHFVIISGVWPFCFNFYLEYVFTKRYKFYKIDFIYFQALNIFFFSNFFFFSLHIYSFTAILNLMCIISFYQQQNHNFKDPNKKVLS